MSTHTNGQSLYEQVAEALRRAIMRGDLAPGDALRSEAELRAEHGVSRDTVRKALNQLTQEGLLTGGQGRTRYVRSYAPLRWALSSYESRSKHTSDSDGQLDAWSTEVQKLGRRPHEEIEVAIVVPPERVAERLNLDTGKDVAVVRRRIRFADDMPYQLADSYFPEPLVRGTPLMQPRSVSAPGGVLASIGHPQSKYTDEIVIRMPSKPESDRLKLQGGTPVAEVTRTGYGPDGTPLRVMVSIAPGDRNVLVYELDAS